MVLIIDCMVVGGVFDGDYMLGELFVVVFNGIVCLKDGGNLVGFIFKFKDGLKNVVEWGIVILEEVVCMVSYVLVVFVGIDNVCG